VRPDYALFAFEEMDEELSRPPLAAIRALQAGGVLPKAEGWKGTPSPLRKAIAVQGSQHRLDIAAIRALISQIPPRHVQLVGSRKEPDPAAVPARLVKALATIHPLTVEQWRSIHPFERFVLDALWANTRLLWRALDEMSKLQGHLLFGITSGQEWVGALARCEVRADPGVMAAVGTKVILDGRAVDLARATGRRIARRAPELLDESSDKTIGPVEVDCRIHTAEGLAVWQAHVSSDDGEFLPGASLLAVTAAAAALCDMLSASDSTVWIAGAAIRQDPWFADAAGDEDSTQAFSRTEMR
jgi:hypothetical protein